MFSRFSRLQRYLPKRSLGRARTAPRASGYFLRASRLRDTRALVSVSSFSVKNYRSFRHEATVEVRPLTLLFGQNNSGKSTLLRTLPLLAESARATNPEDVLAYRSEVARKSSFREIVSRLPSTPASVSFSLAWDDDLFDAAQVALTFRQPDRLGKLTFPILERLVARGRANNQLLDWLWAEDQTAGAEPLYRDAAGGDSFPVQLSGMVPKASGAMGQRLAGVTERLSRLARSVSWLGSIRAAPDRSQRTDGVRRPRRLWHQGEDAVALLFFDKQAAGPLLPAVSRWYEQHFARSLDIRESAGEFSAVLSPVSNPTTESNLADCGEGIAQVLPILTLCAQAESGQLGKDHVIALEQPELHLHTDAQRALARRLCEIARAPGAPRFLIETHSEIFLLELQVEVLKQKLSQDHALLYHVFMAPGGESLLKRVPMDELGRPEGLPRLFGESLELAREISSLRYEAEHAHRS